MICGQALAFIWFLHSSVNKLIPILPLYFYDLTPYFLVMVCINLLTYMSFLTLMLQMI